MNLKILNRISVFLSNMNPNMRKCNLWCESAVWSVISGMYPTLWTQWQHNFFQWTVQSILWANLADNKLMILLLFFFFFFLQKIVIGISCKLSPKETICMKCQSLFLEKNKKTISKCHLLKFLPSLLSVQYSNTLCCPKIWIVHLTTCWCV